MTPPSVSLALFTPELVVAIVTAIAASFLSYLSWKQAQQSADQAARSLSGDTLIKLQLMISASLKDVRAARRDFASNGEALENNVLDLLNLLETVAVSIEDGALKGNSLKVIKDSISDIMGMICTDEPMRQVYKNARRNDQNAFVFLQPYIPVNATAYV